MTISPVQSQPNLSQLQGTGSVSQNEKPAQLDNGKSVSTLNKNSSETNVAESILSRVNTSLSNANSSVFDGTTNALRKVITLLNPMTTAKSHGVEKANIGQTSKQSDIPMTNWMEHLAKDKSIDFGSRKITEISMPGSHDAATYTMKNSLLQKHSVTHTLDLKQQFDLGTRYFDIRVKTNPASENLRFFHGPAQSDKGVVNQEMDKFFSAVLERDEITVIKFQFNGKNAHDAFRAQILNDSIRDAIASPEDIATKSVSELMAEGKKIVIYTKDGDNPNELEQDYKSNSFGKWAKTRRKEKLTAEMDRVRSNIDETNASKLKIIQTNQPAIVGSGSSRFDSVLSVDNKLSSRAVVNDFVARSYNAIDAATTADPVEQILQSAQNLSNLDKLDQEIDFSDKTILETTREMTRGVISLDNIGADEDKNDLMLDIVALNRY